MANITDALENMRSIGQKYGRSLNDIDKIEDSMETAKVTTPIIGKFSSGKSTLVNTLLGESEELLKEDITPETAVPTEVVYAMQDERVTVTKNDGSSYDLGSIDDYFDFEADASTIKSVQLKLRNSFLEEIPSVMLVDMPGFESGYEIHNKAIDNYLPQSMAYIITFPADDMIVRSSVGDILKELSLNDMPLCIVITKYDKAGDAFEETFDHLKKSLAKYIGDKPVQYCITSSRDSDTRELVDFLKQIQGDSQNLLEKKFSKEALSIADSLENYLKIQKNSASLTESELNEKEDELEKRISKIDDRYHESTSELRREVSDCEHDIVEDVSNALDENKDSLVAMAMNKQDIRNKINSVVRYTVTSSLNSRLIPLLEKYLSRVSEDINSDSLDEVNISYDFDLKEMKKSTVASVVAAIGGSLVGMPVFGVFAAAVIAIVGGIVNAVTKNQNKRKIEDKLSNEIFPEIIENVETALHQTVSGQIDSIYDTIEDKIEKEKENIQSSIEKVKAEIDDDNSRKQQLMTQLSEDIDQLEEIKNELR